MRVQRPGRRAAQGTGISAGSLVGLAAAGYGLIRAEAKIARRTIGEPKELPPDPSGVYGRYLGRALRLVMLGDSSATGLGCDSPAQTPGALLAGGVARDMQRRVRLDVVAVVGARSADLDTQVAKALLDRVDVAVIMVGANDVTHRIRASESVRHLNAALTALTETDIPFVLGTCPDLGTIRPIAQPLRWLARRLSRTLAAAQAVAVVAAGGRAVSLGDILGREFAMRREFFSDDQFHPSAIGYARAAEVLLPSAAAALGLTTVSQPAGPFTSTRARPVAQAAARAASLDRKSVV